MQTESNLTPLKAVLIGHAVVTAPVIAIMAVTALILYVAVSPRPGASTLLAVDIGVVLGAALGWLWWSASVPRWREWAELNGAEKYHQ